MTKSKGLGQASYGDCTTTAASTGTSTPSVDQQMCVFAVHFFENYCTCTGEEEVNSGRRFPRCYSQDIVKELCDSQNASSAGSALFVLANSLY